MSLPQSNTSVTEIVTNLDDVSPQIIANTLDALFDAGVLDAWTSPIGMKKNRPAVQLSVLCHHDHVQKIAKLIFTHTASFGLRYKKWDRIVLDREHCPIELPQGQINIKVGKLQGKTLVATPEYDEAVKLAQISNTPLKQILTTASAIAQEKFIQPPQTP